MLRVFTALLLCVLSIFVLVLDWFRIGLFFSLLSYILLLYHTQKTSGINSVLFLFMLLFGLYGYSVPVSVFFDADIGWHRVEKLRTWQNVDGTLISYLISNQLALLAISFLYIFLVNRKIMNIEENHLKTPRITYYWFAIVAGIISSLSEALNFIRAGGFASVMQGKAHYQGAVNDLALNIPYEGFFFISVAMFSQFLASKPGNVKYFTYLPIYIASISFVLFINILIGERGLLVVAMVIVVLGFTIHKRIRIVKIKYLVLLGFLYVGFNVMTLLREKTIEYEGAENFIENYGRKLVQLMNPANTEFGSPALNYRIYKYYAPEDEPLKWGKSYTEIIWGFVPTYVYPDKPKGIIFEFRDRYFPERKRMGSTAGTGFSSLMEAHMNFGYLGPFLVYLFSVFCLIYFESKRGKNSLFINLFYLLLFNIFLIYTRSASQYILFNVLLYVIQILIVVTIYNSVPKRIYYLITPTENESS